jgi:hypothetical protein
MAGPKVGEILFHHGRRHEILGFRGDKFWFRNGGFLGRGETADLRFSEGDGWWYLPGRVLANDERTVVNAMMGAWPSAASHLAMRKVLDVEGPLADHVDLEALKRIIVVRRTDAIQRTDGESDAAFDKRVAGYTLACLAHCEELRAFRAGKADPPLPKNDGSPAAVKLRRIPGGGPYKVRKGVSRG